MKITLPVMLPSGRSANKTGTLVNIKSQNENWNDYVLEDGTTIRTKQTALQAVRLDDEYDQVGNPIYVIQTTPVSVVNSPDALKKK